MGLADTERNRAAVHEAGHGLIATSRGLGVAVMELHAIDGEGGMRLREEPSVLDRVWVLYGGPFAEKVIFGRLTSAAIPPERDELLLAHKLCREIGINNTIGLMDQVETYLREHQSLLELVATQLLEANKLQGADLYQLLRTDFPTTQRKVLGVVIPHATAETP
jgi:ATP-dependent Zn protease